MRAMKDSGIEWIGEIPVGWDVLRIKTLSTVSRGASPRPIDNPIYFDENGTYSWVRISDVTQSNRYLYNAGEKLSKLGISKTVPLEPNTLIISICASVGKPCITKIKCCIHDGFVHFPQLNSLYNEYFYYIFTLGECYAGLGKLGTQLNLNTETIGNIKIPLPPKKELSLAIQNLNSKCAAIDAAIKNQRATVNKLKEYRQAVITEAVTKGLNPNAPMKDSGIEWIGEIPNQWKIMAIGYDIAKIESGTSVNAAYYSATETEKGVLKTSCVYNFSFDPNENKCVEEYDSERVSCPLKKDTIIVSRMNTPELVGACGYVTESSDNIYLPDRLWQISFLREINPKYAWRYLCSTGVRWILGQVATGSSNSMKNLSQEQFKRISIPLPPISEQTEIAAYLDKKCTAIDSAVSKKETLIDKMTEYKKSLIYEAVTGKIEVES